MSRWTSILTAILLVLTLWAGGPANAAEQFACNSAVTAAADYDGGTQDQSPMSPDNCATHSHGGCASHHLAAPASAPLMELALQETARFGWHQVGVAGHSPDSELRPPIA